MPRGKPLTTEAPMTGDAEDDIPLQITLVDPAPEQPDQSSQAAPGSSVAVKKLKRPKPRKPNGKKARNEEGDPDEYGIPGGKSQRGANLTIPKAPAGPKTTCTSAREIKHKERVARALEYRKQGQTFAKIGEQMNLSCSQAYQLVAEGLHNIVSEPAAELYAMQLERLNQLLESIYSAATGGDIRALEAALKVMERIDRLVGLERAADLAAARGTQVNNKIVIQFVDTVEEAHKLHDGGS